MLTDGDRNLSRKPEFRNAEERAPRPEKLPLPADTGCDRRRSLRKTGLHITKPEMSATIFGE